MRELADGAEQRCEPLTVRRRFVLGEAVAEQRRACVGAEEGHVAMQRRGGRRRLLLTVLVRYAQWDAVNGTERRVRPHTGAFGAGAHAEPEPVIAAAIVPVDSHSYKRRLGDELNPDGETTGAARARGA